MHEYECTIRMCSCPVSLPSSLSKLSLQMTETVDSWLALSASQDKVSRRQDSQCWQYITREERQTAVSIELAPLTHHAGPSKDVIAIPTRHNDSVHLIFERWSKETKKKCKRLTVNSIFNSSVHLSKFTTTVRLQHVMLPTQLKDLSITSTLWPILLLCRLTEGLGFYFYCP